MSYTLKYEKGIVKTTFNEHKIKFNSKRICIAILACMIIATLLLSSKSKELRDIIIPGNAAVTEAALNTLIADIKDGEPLSNAIFAFCNEIYSNATYYR